MPTMLTSVVECFSTIINCMTVNNDKGIMTVDNKGSKTVLLFLRL